MSNKYHFQNEFGSDRQMPSEILNAIDRGELVDNSWHNDANPSFCYKGVDNFDDRTGDETDLRLWVREERLEDREDEGPRFSVYSGMGGEDDQVLFDTDDVNEAIQRLRDEATKLIAKRAALPDKAPEPPHVDDVDAAAVYGFGLGQQFIHVCKNPWRRGSERGMELRTELVRITKLRSHAFEYVVDEVLSIENPLFPDKLNSLSAVGLAGGISYDYAQKLLVKGDELILIPSDDRGFPMMTPDGVRFLYPRWTLERFMMQLQRMRTKQGLVHGIDIAPYVKRVKREILADIANGVVPSTVKDYSELHDYTDANCYGGMCDGPFCKLFPTDNGLMDDKTIDLANAITEVVDEWLRNGRK